MTTPLPPVFFVVRYANRTGSGWVEESVASAAAGLERMEQLKAEGRAWTQLRVMVETILAE